MNLKLAKEVGYFSYFARRVFWRLRPPAFMTLPTGVAFPTPKGKFFASDVYVSSCNVDWNSEFILALFLKSNGKTRDFLDVGAHIGYYSCLVSPFVSRVFAFEPDERNIPHLRKSLAIVPHAEIIRKAVADHDGEIYLSDEGESSVSHISSSPQAGNAVSVTTIDNFTLERSLEPIAIKIDIEGFDILALQGAVKTCEIHQPVFLVEYNQEEGRPNTWAALREFADQMRCMLYAVSKHDAGLMKDTFEFKRYTTGELPGLVTKMIFIVPPAHNGWFEKFAATHPSWTNRDLRPKAVARLLSESH